MNKLKTALAEALIPEYESLLAEASSEHIFSESFEKKMKTLINRRRKPYFRMINTVGKRAACIAVCVVIACTATLNIGAVKETVHQFFAEVFFDRYIPEAVSLPAKTGIFAENITSPQGILCRENDILIADSEENCIYQYDYSGKLLNTIGTLGNAPLEFYKPTDITEFGGEIYIIDGLNDRIQVLDSNLNFAREIPVPRIDHIFGVKSDAFLSIAVNDEGKIFLSGSFIKENADRIYCMNADGSDWHAIGKTPFVGVLFSDGKDVYAINNAENQSYRKDVFQSESESCLYKVTEKRVKKLLEFENIYVPTDFIIDGEEIIMASYTNTGVVKTGMNGKYIGELADLQGEFYIDKAPDGTIFVTCEDSNSVYRITEQKYNGDDIS